MSLKEVKGNLKYYYKDDKRIFVGYLLFTMKRFFLIPKRAIAKLFFVDAKDKKYKRTIKDEKEITLSLLGKKFIVSSSDIGLSRDLIINGVREPHCVEMMKKILKKGMNVVEVGANIGYFVLQEYVILEGSKSKIYAIEPSPSCIEYLKKNIKLNSMKNVKVLNMGISDKEGEMTFLVSNKWNLSRFENVKKNNYSDIIAKIPVKIKTLDSLFGNKKVNLIRTDIEGYEYYMIKGAEKVFANNKNLILYIEFHPYLMSKQQRVEITRILKKHNFAIKSAFLHSPYESGYLKNFTFKDMAGKPYFFPLHLVIEKSS